MSQKRPFFATAFFTAIGRSLGVIIPFFIAIIYGANPATDAFFFAYGLIFSLMAVFTHIFESALIPYLTEEKKEPNNLFGLANGILLVSLPVIGIICLLIWLGLTPVLVQWGGWNGVSARLVAQLFLEMTPLLILSVWIAQTSSVFYVEKIFWFPAFSPLIRSLVVLVFLFGVHQTFGIHALTGGFIVGEVARWGMALLFLFRLTTFKFQIPWRQIGGRILIFFKQTSLQILALVAISLLVVTDQWFGALLGPGSLSLFNYADRLLQIPYILFLAGFLQIYLSDWSDSYYYESSSFFWPKIQRDTRSVFFGALTFSIALWFGRDVVVRIIYGLGRLSGKEQETVANLCGWLAVSFVPGVIRLLYARVLFVMKRSLFYCMQSWCELGVKIVSNYFLVRRFGVVGIAMSTALVYSLTTLWLHFYIKKYRDETTMAQ